MDLVTVGAAPDVEAAARLIAEDDRAWLQVKGRVVCWLAVRMQVAAGVSVHAAERLFNISRKTIQRWSPDWKDKGCEADLPRIADVVRRAIALRREMTGETGDAAHDDAWCKLPRPKPASGFGDEMFAAARRRGRKAAADAAAEIFREEMSPWMADAHRNALLHIAGDEMARAPWPQAAHAAQQAPRGTWRVWMMMGGRGAGKTRAGAEWVRDLVERGLAKRIALVGPTLHDVREVMIGGPSGLEAVADPKMRPTYEVTRRRLVWPKEGPCAGAVAYAFSAEDPDTPARAAVRCGVVR